MLLSNPLSLKPGFSFEKLRIFRVKSSLKTASLGGILTQNADPLFASVSADPGRLERAAAAFRLPGTVMVGTAWRQEKSCRLFAFLGPCGARSRQTGTRAEDGSERGERVSSGQFRAAPM